MQQIALNMLKRYAASSDNCEPAFVNSSLLKLLSNELCEEDFSELAQEGGFEEPNNFDISRFCACH